MTASKDQVAQLIVAEAKARSYTREECLAVMSALYQESEWREDVWDSTHVTYGIAQQDGSYPNRFNGAAAQIKGFFDKLDKWRKKPGASGDIWLNICWMQQRPNWESAQYWWDNGRKAYLTEIKSRIATVTPYLNQHWPTGGAVTDERRPAFNEFELWSDNNGPRNAKVDCFLLHTQEGGGGDAAAENLAKWFQHGNEVSYHYTISQASDGGVTVVDCVDTDRASWSVLSANGRSINLCFAGSKSSWTRNDWLLKAGKAIDVAAYLAVQDAKKYGFPVQVVPPPYTARIPGISDHGYVTKVLKDGTHTDVSGPAGAAGGFPWDIFAERVLFWATPTISAPTPVPTPPIKPPLTDSQKIGEVWDQLRGPGGGGWDQLGGRTPVDYLAHLGQKVDALAAMVTALVDALTDVTAPDAGGQTKEAPGGTG